MIRSRSISNASFSPSIRRSVRVSRGSADRSEIMRTTKIDSRKSVHQNNRHTDKLFRQSSIQPARAGTPAHRCGSVPASQFPRTASTIAPASAPPLPRASAAKQSGRAPIASRRGTGPCRPTTEFLCGPPACRGTRTCARNKGSSSERPAPSWRGHQILVSCRSLHRPPKSASLPASGSSTAPIQRIGQLSHKPRRHFFQQAKNPAIAQHHFDRRTRALVALYRERNTAFGRHRNRHKASLVIRCDRQLAHPRLPPPRMNHVGVNIVPPRKLRNAEASRQALRNEPQLLGRCPAPPPLTTRKHRNARHVCPLTCQLTGTRSHAREARGRRGRPDAYVLPAKCMRPLSTPA